MQAGYECLNADVLDGCLARPQTSSSVSLDLLTSSSPPDLQDILYTNTPRLLSGPSYSAKSASPTLSAGHSPRALEVAPAAHLNSFAMQDSFNCQPSTQIVWEAETGGRQQKPANSVADGNHSGAAVATLISPGVSCRNQFAAIVPVLAAGSCPVVLTTTMPAGVRPAVKGLPARARAAASLITAKQ